MVSDLRRDPRFDCAALDHSVGIYLAHRTLGQSPRAALGGRKEIVLRVAGEPGTVDIGMKVSVQAVTTGHLVPLTAFFMQPNPGAAFLRIDIFNLHLKRGANAGKRVDHQAG